MAANLEDKFKKTGTGTGTTLASPGKAVGAESINVGSTANYPTDTGIIIAIKTVDTGGNTVPGTYTEWKAVVVSDTSITIDPTPVYGSDQVYAAGSTTQVFVPVSSSAQNTMVDGMTAEHNQNGTHKDIVKTVAQTFLQNLVKNGQDLNNSTNGYGNTPDNHTASNANAVQGGFYDLTPAIIEALGLPAAANCKAFYKLNGNFTDVSGNGYNLTAGAGGAAPTDSDDGLMAKAKAFASASSQYAEIADASCPGLEIAGSQTWIGFAKPAAIGAAMAIMSKDNNSPRGKNLMINADNTFGVRMTGLTTTSLLSSDIKTEANKWYMVALVYDSANSKLKLFVNGITKEATASGSASDSNAIFTVGAKHSGATNAKEDYFNGLLQMCSVYDVAWTNDQLKKLFRKTLGSGLKARRAGGTDALMTSDELILDAISLRGKTITAACDVIQEVASTAYISIDDGTETESTPSATIGSVVVLSATKTISATATTVKIKRKVKTSNGSVWFGKSLSDPGLRVYFGSNVLPFIHSQDDWDRFPRVIKEDYPGVKSGYQFEEGKWFNCEAPSFDVTKFDDGAGGQPTTRSSRFKIVGQELVMHWNGTGVKAGTNILIAWLSNSMPVDIKSANYGQRNAIGTCMVLDTLAANDFCGSVSYYSADDMMYMLISNAVTDNRALTDASFSVAYEIN